MMAGHSIEMQEFAGGATRNTDKDKYDYEGFLNPEALHAFGAYMHAHRMQKDGTLRDADNWQKGIPLRTYVKSLIRHAIDLWRLDRGYTAINPDTGEAHTKQELACAIVFNALGYLKELVDPASVNVAAVRPETEPRRANLDEAICWHVGPTYVCDRPQGHIGDHLAWEDYERRILYSPGGHWPNTGTV